jgi:hypothetical protein
MASIIPSFENNNTSSRKRRRFKEKDDPILILFITLVLFTSTMALLDLSPTKRKSKEDKGYPCL